MSDVSNDGGKAGRESSHNVWADTDSCHLGSIAVLQSADPINDLQGDEAAKDEQRELRPSGSLWTYPGASFPRLNYSHKATYRDGQSEVTKMPTGARRASHRPLADVPTTPNLDSHRVANDPDSVQLRVETRRLLAQLDREPWSLEGRLGLQLAPPLRPSRCSQTLKLPTKPLSPLRPSCASLG